MHYYAGSASEFLGQHDAGHTAAFVNWFGSFTKEGFDGKDTAEQYAQSEWANRGMMRSSAGFYLLHEMTHLPVLVEGFKYWILNKGAYRSSDFGYTPSECSNLPEKRRISNAQSYAIFALEVASNSKHASQKVKGNVKDKDNEACWLLRKGRSKA
ncbi:uncharacterized protein LY79DRAFT_656698 [Colletotrichum navitas]|uniref:Metalloprotease n=1 Tax=Colletotrichum navitas TaxID=681940 RepID=A0AAD8Q7A5_9PEZI|nr:uncharacterized protein LY79DRAFT_656698 [Colletotrichum navitas]KAK1597025.1 hypothetical protein LY79DRAFT_656698 [Colletotrichum navitas]